MALRLVLAVLPVVLASACGTTRVVRLDTGGGEPLIHLPRTDEAEPVELEEEEFTLAMAEQARQVKSSANPEQAARELFDVPERSGWYGFNPRQGLIPQKDPPRTLQGAPADVELTRLYRLWCERKGKPGDCLGLLVRGPVVTGDGRYTLGMAFAMDRVLPEMAQAFQDMADPEAIKASLLWTMTLYMALWTMPEPVSKGVAAVLTATFIAYLGVDAVWTLVVGWTRLVETVDHATTFEEIREAGERYGRVMGRNAARAFALLAMAVMGQTAAGFAAKVPRLPGSAQASVVAEAQAGIRLPAVAQVDTVAVSAEAVTMALSPNAVAPTVQGGGGAASSPVEAQGPEHHIATDNWPDATHSGGPWTPLFQKIFKRAGMSLNDPANKVRVKGHKGPHPEEYHQEVFRRLDRATATCRTIAQCREALVGELQRLAEESSTPGTRLNKLVTRTE